MQDAFGVVHTVSKGIETLSRYVPKTTGKSARLLLRKNPAGSPLTRTQQNVSAANADNAVKGLQMKHWTRSQRKANLQQARVRVLG